MKTFLVMRFGIPHPTQEETRLMFRIAANSRPEGGPFPGASPTAMSGVMSVIKSNLTAQQIADEFQKMSVGMSNDTGEQQGSIYPVIVHEINPDVSLSTAAVIARAMRLRVENRTKSAAQFKEELNNSLIKNKKRKKRNRKRRWFFN